MVKKSSVEEIRRRFDADVERFSNLEIGQAATVDSVLAMELVTAAAARTTPHAADLLDVGCGAGNYVLKLLERLPNRNVRLVDLSGPMLERAVERIGAVSSGIVTAMQGDVREIHLGSGTCDIIVAASVLHHLRTEEEWRAVLTKFHEALRPGGSVWVFDLVTSGIDAVQDVMSERYGDYLRSLKGEDYRKQVFAYIEQEDTPRPLVEQLDLLREAGFAAVDVLHKNACFAAYGGVKGG